MTRSQLRPGHSACVKQTSWFSLFLEVGEVLGAGGDDVGGLGGDQGAVGVGDEAGVSVAGG